MNVLKWLAIAAGGYLLYEHFYGTSTVIAPSQPTAAAPSQAAATQPAAPSQPAATQPAAINQTTRDRLVALVSVQEPTYHSTGGLLSYHVWNVYYAIARGVDPTTLPTSSAAGQGDGTRLISVDEYLSAIAGVGLSGLAAMRMYRRAWGI